MLNKTKHSRKTPTRNVDWHITFEGKIVTVYFILPGVLMRKIENMQKNKSVFYGILVLIGLVRITTVYSSQATQLLPEKPLTVLTQTVKVPDRGSNSNGSILKSPSPRYILIADVLDGLGGVSKSTEYEIPFCSEGQAFFMGTMESSNYQAKSGYVWAINIKRGDVNQDGMISIGDVVYLINYLFRGGDQPIPRETGDINCDEGVDVGDVVYLINYLFGQGPPPCN
jgi:hypothetical protein